MGEETAVVGRNIHVVIALVDMAKETEEVPPDRLRIELVVRLEGRFEQIAAHQLPPLGKCDEENAVENFLRRLDRCAEREFRSVEGINKEVDQPLAQTPVILVQPVGDVGVGGVCLAQKPRRRLARGDCAR